MSRENGESLIRSVQAFSTGEGGQHPEHRFGTWKPSLWWVLMSRKWIEIPILVYVIEHCDGLVLFDAVKLYIFPDECVAIATDLR